MSLISLLNRHKLWIVLLVALAARGTVLLLFPNIFAFEQTGTIHGSEAYDVYAQNLNATGVYGRVPGVPDANIPPLYSYALAVIYAALGRGYLQVGFFHTALDLVSMLLLYAITIRITRPTLEEGAAAWVGALAVAAYAVYPYLIFQNLTLIDTPFFMTLTYAFILAMVLLRERESWSGETFVIAVVGGALLGISLMTRPILPPLALLMALWFLFRRPLGQTIVRLGVVAVVSIAVVIPWMLRTSAVYGTFVPLSVTSGSNLWQGNNEDVVAILRAGYDVQWTSPTLTSADRDSAEADRERTALVWAYWNDHPEQLPELFWTKFLVHWSIDIAPRLNPTAGVLPRLDYQGDAQATESATGELTLGGLPPGDPVDTYSTPLFDQIGRLLHRLYFGTLFVLAVIGMGLSLRGWRDLSLLWCIQISMTVVYVLFHPSTRYRVPTDPLLFVLSAFAVVTLWQGLIHRRAAKGTV